MVVFHAVAYLGFYERGQRHEVLGAVGV